MAELPITAAQAAQHLALITALAAGKKLQFRKVGYTGKWKNPRSHVLRLGAPGHEWRIAPERNEEKLDLIARARGLIAELEASVDEEDEQRMYD